MILLLLKKRSQTNDSAGEASSAVACLERLFPTSASTCSEIVLSGVEHDAAAYDIFQAKTSDRKIAFNHAAGIRTQVTKVSRVPFRAARGAAVRTSTRVVVGPGRGTCSSRDVPELVNVHAVLSRRHPFELHCDPNQPLWLLREAHNSLHLVHVHHGNGSARNRLLLPHMIFDVETIIFLCNLSVDV